MSALQMSCLSLHYAVPEVGISVTSNNLPALIMSCQPLLLSTLPSIISSHGVSKV